MIRPRNLHHLERVADLFLGRGVAPRRGAPPAQQQVVPIRAPVAVRPPDPPRIAIVARGPAEARLARQLARAAGDWNGLGTLAEAAALSDPARPSVRPLDALVCVAGPADGQKGASPAPGAGPAARPAAATDCLPPRLAADLGELLAGCRVRRLILLLIVPAGTAAAAARSLAAAAGEALASTLGRAVAVICAREEDLRGDPSRTPAVLGAVRLAVARRVGPGRTARGEEGRGASRA